MNVACTAPAYVACTAFAHPARPGTTPQLPRSTPTTPAGRLSLKSYASFLNSSTSRWEALHDQWPLTAGACCCCCCHWHRSAAAVAGTAPAAPNVLVALPRENSIRDDMSSPPHPCVACRGCGRRVPHLPERQADVSALYTGSLDAGRGCRKVGAARAGPQHAVVRLPVTLPVTLPATRPRFSPPLSLSLSLRLPAAATSG